MVDRVTVAMVANQENDHPITVAIVADHATHHPITVDLVTVAMNHQIPASDYVERTSRYGFLRHDLVYFLIYPYLSSPTLQNYSKKSSKFTIYILKPKVINFFNIKYC